MKRSEYLPYLRTLRRVPDDVVLATAAADLCLGRPNACLCGWFVREQVARMLNVDPDALDAQGPEVRWASDGSGVIDSCANLFGGSVPDWNAIFLGVCPDRSERSLIERAFVERIMEAVA